MDNARRHIAGRLGFKSLQVEEKLPELSTDALEQVLQHMSLRELARIAHGSKLFTNVMRKRMKHEHSRWMNLVLDGRFFLWPAQASILLRTCRRLACGLNIASGEALPTGDHMWVGVIKRDGTLHVRNTYTELRECPRDDDDAPIEVSFTSKVGPFGLRFFAKGFLEIGYPFKRRAPGPTSHAFVATFKAFWFRGPMAIRVRLFSPPEHDWVRGLLLMLLKAEEVHTSDSNEADLSQASPISLPVQLPARGSLEDLEPWDPLHAAGASFRRKQF
eukprot:jgi/Botrbrau1/21518/Bobra.174_2s0021.1